MAQVSGREAILAGAEGQRQLNLELIGRNELAMGQTLNCSSQDRVSDIAQFLPLQYVRCRRAHLNRTGNRRINIAIHKLKKNE